MYIQKKVVSKIYIQKWCAYKLMHMLYIYIYDSIYIYINITSTIRWPCAGALRWRPSGVACNLWDDCEGPCHVSTGWCRRGLWPKDLPDNLGEQRWLELLRNLYGVHVYILESFFMFTSGVLFKRCFATNQMYINILFGVSFCIWDVVERVLSR